MFKVVPGSISTTLVLFMEVVGISWSWISLKGSSSYLLSNAASIMWHCKWGSVCEKLLMRSSSIWSLKFRASSIVKGDLMFSKKYDAGGHVLIIDRLGWAGGYKAKFLT